VTQLKAEVFGVPQFRRRLHLGGIKGKNAENYDLNVLAEKKISKLTTVGEAISDLPPLSDGGGGFNEMDYRTVKQLSAYQKKARQKSRRLYNHWCSKNSQEVIDTIGHILPGSSLMKQWASLPESTKKRYKVQSNIHSNIYKRLSWPLQSPTIVHARRAMLLHPVTNRIITVREAARLQSFPDFFRFFGPLNNQYQQVANAVPPLVAKALGNFYYKFIGEQKNDNK
jgi:DNA (cytosine-5)-methyltransferase 1